MSCLKNIGGTWSNTIIIIMRIIPESKQEPSINYATTCGGGSLWSGRFGRWGIAIY